ncbi:MAG TPA: carbon-nitrogen hydrolase family protein [bacterium]|nr:carbon-nitrogen hydrolase family protein [bacterium]
MERKLTLALIQQHATQDKALNIQRAIKTFETAARSGAQLVVFAELAFSWFYPQRPATGNITDLAEPIPGPTTDIFSQLARRWKKVVVLNLFELKNEQTFDASPVIDSDGNIIGVTRMAHIMEGPCFHEQGYYAPGRAETLVYDTTYGKIGVAICYDRHFPEYMRALGLQGAELVVVPQAGAVGEWPQGLFEAEMQVAGFQNGYFTALCNRVGKEDCVEFEGKSFITAPDGKILAQASAGKDALLICEIDLAQTSVSHARRHFLKDRRPEIYTQWFST